VPRSWIFTLSKQIAVASTLRFLSLLCLHLSGNDFQHFRSVTFPVPWAHVLAELRLSHKKSSCCYAEAYNSRAALCSMVLPLATFLSLNCHTQTLHGPVESTTSNSSIVVTCIPVTVGMWQGLHRKHRVVCRYHAAP
jgi:hypothetical protein